MDVLDELLEAVDRGYCATCRTVVEIDGQQGDAEGSVWSHIRAESREVVVPGHDPRCQGDCRHCPVPVPDVEVFAVECGPVYVNPGAASAPPPDARPPWASEAGPGLPRPEDGRPVHTPRLGGPAQLSQPGDAAASGLSRGTSPARSLAVLDVCDNPDCGRIRPDQFGLSIAGEDDRGFCSQACLVVYVRRRYMERSLMGLTPFEGNDVAEIGLIVRNTGDGLSDVVKVDPVELHVGDEGFIVFQYRVEKIRFDEIKDSEDLKRVQILRAGTATFVDGSVVGEAIDQQRQRIEAAKGVQRLPLDGEQDEEGDDLDDEEWETPEAELAAQKARKMLGADE